MSQCEEQAHAQGNSNNSRTPRDGGEEETRPLTGSLGLSLTSSPSSTRQTRTKVIPPCDSPITSDHLPPMDEAPPPYEHVPANRRSSNPVQGQPLTIVLV